jgi:hypothetical protein
MGQYSGWSCHDPHIGFVSQKSNAGITHSFFKQKFFVLIFKSENNSVCLSWKSKSKLKFDHVKILADFLTRFQYFKSFLLKITWEKSSID